MSAVFAGYTLFSDSSYINGYFFNSFDAIFFGTIILTMSFGLIIKKYWSIALVGFVFGYSIIRSIILFIIGVSEYKSITFLVLFIFVHLIWLDYFYQRRSHYN